MDEDIITDYRQWESPMCFIYYITLPNITQFSQWLSKQSLTSEQWLKLVAKITTVDDGKTEAGYIYTFWDNMVENAWINLLIDNIPLMPPKAQYKALQAILVRQKAIQQTLDDELNEYKTDISYFTTDDRKVWNAEFSAYNQSCKKLMALHPPPMIDLFNECKIGMVECCRKIKEAFLTVQQLRQERKMKKAQMKPVSLNISCFF